MELLYTTEGWWLQHIFCLLYILTKMNDLSHYNYISDYIFKVPMVWFFGTCTTSCLLEKNKYQERQKKWEEIYVNVALEWVWLLCNFKSLLSIKLYRNSILAELITILLLTIWLPEHLLIKCYPSCFDVLYLKLKAV